MSATTIAQAAQDFQLTTRVSALAQREVRTNPDLAATEFGQQVLAGSTNLVVLNWGVAVDEEAAYEAAMLNGRGAPGHDADVITDAAIVESILGNWPGYTPPPPPAPPA